MRKTKYLKSNMNNSRLLGLKFVRALNNYSKWRRFWTSPVQVTKNLESSRLACTGIPSTTGSPKITKRSPNVERNKVSDIEPKGVRAANWSCLLTGQYKVLCAGLLTPQTDETWVVCDHSNWTVVCYVFVFVLFDQFSLSFFVNQ